ncbi:MAG: DUF4340 domain-containing protein [Elusimicrobiota bacterium]
MNFKKKLFVLLILCAFVSVGVMLLFFKGRSFRAESQPLAKVDFSQVKKFIIDNRYGSYTFEKVEEEWVIMAPNKDTADVVFVNDVLRMAKVFSVSSLITNNKSKFDQFDLQPEKAPRFQVFTTDLSKPTLDIYLGKMTSGYNESFMRFSSQDAVYIAKDLMPYKLAFGPNYFRAKRLFPDSLKDLTSLQINLPGVQYSVNKDSNTWITSAGKKYPEPYLLNLIVDLEGLSAIDFASIESISEGVFDKPYGSFFIKGPQFEYQIIIGKERPQPAKELPITRYVRSNKRNMVLVHYETSFKKISETIKSLPQ